MRGTVAKILVCVLVLAALAVPAVFVNTAIGYVPALFFVLLLAVCYGYLRLCQRGLVFDELLASSTCVRGGSSSVVLRVANRSPLFVPRVSAKFVIRNLYQRSATQEQFCFSIGPKGVEDFTFDLEFPHIGEFEVGLEELQVYCPLGLFVHRLDVHSVNTVLVTPRLREVGALALADTAVQQVSDALRPNNMEGTDYMGVREYAPGDPMKTIHWKLSAHSDGYFTKLFEDYSEPRLDIFLSTCAPEYNDEDLMCVMDVAVESALSLAEYAHARGVESRIVYVDAFGETQNVRLGSGFDLREFMSVLPRIEVDDGDAFAQMLERQATAMYAADNIAVCSAVCDARLTSAALLVKGSQRNVLMFVLVPQRLDEQEKVSANRRLTALRDSGVPCWLVSSEAGEIA